MWKPTLLDPVRYVQSPDAQYGLLQRRSFILWPRHQSPPMTTIYPAKLVAERWEATRNQRCCKFSNLAPIFRLANDPCATLSL